jgi:hypothetical protein
MSGAKWQRVKIDLPDVYGPEERRAIALDVLDFIRKRTQDGRDKKNRSFPGYSKSYEDSLDFKIAGKSKGQVDLTLSGDMLGALDLLSHKNGQIMVGYENGTEENAKADGNIRGTYGGKSTGKRRDFLGITSSDLGQILERYPVKGKNADQKRQERVEAVLAALPEDED